MKKFFEGVGQTAVGGISFAGGVFLLFARTVACAFMPPLRLKQTLEQMVKIGLDSLTIATLTSFFTGVVLAFQSAYQMQRVNAEMYIPTLVSISICRELGPVLTALVVAGRVGASIAAELGSMKVTEQIEALETLAAPPVKYLVAPRFLALFLMLPLLTVYADAVGLFGGYLVSVYKLDLTHALFMRMTFDPLALKDVVTGLLKTFVFAALICVISCHEGMRVEGGAAGVGRATTRAVVFSFIAVIVADAIFTVIFYFT